MGKIIIITGGLATLKTTISKKLSEDLKVISFNKDDIKESLVESIGFINRSENKKLSQATVSLMIRLAKNFSILHKDLILEANFKQNELNELYTNTSYQDKDILTIDLYGNEEILYDRYVKRNAFRHPAHTSTGLMSMDMFKASIKAHEISSHKGTYKRYDTSYFNDEVYQELCAYVREFLLKS